jgi:hypothetical protein
MKLYLSNDVGGVLTHEELKTEIYPVWRELLIADCEQDADHFTFDDFMAEAQRYKTLIEIDNDNTIVEDRKTGYTCSLEFALKMVEPEQLEEYATHRDGGIIIHHLLY